MLNVPIAVKKALKEGTHKKNYRFVVLNDDGTADFTIDNDTLVAESVMIDERMATGSELKFGLCEGSSLEFQYFDHDNIRGRQLQVFIDVEYGEEEPYAIPMGFFTVKSCSMQFSTGIFKATCYNKLMSDYLDAKANDILLNSYETTSNVLLADISRLLLDDYQIKNDIEPATKYPGTVDFRGNSTYYATPFYFTSLYGIESPISAAGYNQFDTPSLSQPFYIGIEGAASTYLLDETNKYWIIKELAGKLSDLEQHTIDRIKYLIDSAQITTTSTTPPFTGGAVTGDMFVDFLMGQTGYFRWERNFFGISVAAMGGTTEYYSTAKWNYEERNGLAHTVAGTLSDVIDVSHKSNAVMALDIVTLYSLAVLKDYTSLSAGYYRCYFGDTQNYPYWTNAQHDTAYVEMAPIKYGNNKTDYIARDIPGGYEYNIEDYMPVGYPIYGEAEQVQVNIATLPEFTLRDIVSANYETLCQYGQLDRVTDLFSGVELNGGGLYPSETLYPADGLYPNANTGGQGFHPYPSEYSKLWTDTQGEQSFRYLIITYKGLDENNQEVEKTLQRTVNADGTTDYNMSDNWLFRNLVWADADVGDYADAMVTKMQGIRWFPFEMWAAGLPYVETGDAIEITDRNGGSHVSYVLQRQLQGIQNLQDTYVNGELDIF